jgi:hypothetical protein
MTNEKSPAGGQAGRGSVGEQLEEIRRRAQANADFTRTHLVDCDRPGCLMYGVGRHEESQVSPAFHQALEVKEDWWEVAIDWDSYGKRWELVVTTKFMQDVVPVGGALRAVRSFEGALLEARGRLKELKEL